MTTSISDDQLAEAARILRSGGLVAFPTETVYGLGGDATNARAVAEIFAAKGRPRFAPIIVHLSAPQHLETITTEISPTAASLAETFWPGPLTLVLPRAATIPPIVSSGLSTVAVRVPAHPAARRLIAMADCPIAAPSANRFGGLSPTTATHVIDQLGEKIELILDGGPCRVGVESTVLDVSGPGPVLLRPGGVTREELEEAIGPITVGTVHSSTDHAAPAPGMLARHYSPDTPVTITDTLDSAPAGRLGLLTLRRPSSNREWARVEVLSESGDLVEAAAGFFAALHRLDDAGLDRIIALPFPDSGLGLALNNRLDRAAST